MAEFTKLPINYVDDILSSSNTRRKYRQTDNLDGTKSFTDVTEYDQEGTDFGALDVNRTNKAINDLYANRIVSLDDLDLVTETGFFVDALAVKGLLPSEISRDNFKLRNLYNVMFFDAWKTGKVMHIYIELFFTGEDSGFLENNLYELNTASSSSPLDSYLCPEQINSLNIVSTDGRYVQAVNGICVIDENGRIRYSFPSKPQRYIFINGIYRTKE